MSNKKAEALANLEMLRDGIEHHKKIGEGTRQIWLGWIRVAVHGIEGYVKMQCGDCGDISQRGRSAKKCDICGGEVKEIS